MTLRDYLKHLAIVENVVQKFDRELQVDVALQRARSLGGGITPKPGGNIRKPLEFEGVGDELFADPVNFRFPVTEDMGEMPCEAFNVALGMGLGYSTEELRLVAETIARMVSSNSTQSDWVWTYDEYGRLSKVEREYRSRSTDEYEYSGPPKNTDGGGMGDYEGLPPGEQIEIVEGAAGDEVIEIVADAGTSGNGRHEAGDFGIVEGEAFEAATVSEVVDVTANTIRIRQQDPGKFNKASFRMKRLTAGVQAVIGRLKGSSKTTVQSLVFDKKKFDLGKAKKWAKDHGFRSESSEREIEVEFESILRAPRYEGSGIDVFRNLIFESVGAMRTQKGGVRELFAPSGRIFVVEKALDDIEEGELEFITPLVLIGEYTGNNNRYSRRCVEHMRDAIAALFESTNLDFLKGKTTVESSSDRTNSVLQISQGRYFGWPRIVESFISESMDYLLEADQVGLNGTYANVARLPDMYTSHEARFANLQREKCGYMREVFIEEDVGFMRARTINTAAGKDMSVLIQKNQITGVSLVGWATEAEENDKKGKDVDLMHMLGTDFTDFPGMPFKSEHAHDPEKAVGLFNMVN